MKILLLALVVFMSADAYGYYDDEGDFYRVQRERREASDREDQEQRRHEETIKAIEENNCDNPLNISLNCMGRRR